MPPSSAPVRATQMGHAAAESVVDAGLELVPVTFTANPAAGTIAVRDVEVELKGLDGMAEAMEEIKARYPDLMVIDYTLPQAVNPNAELYTSLGLPFVMGTTGGDCEGLLATVDAAGTYAVISPNMGKQIVALQSMLEYAEDTFPGAWAGYKLEVVESHQSTKVDTSGTAKALVKSFQGLGMGDFAEEDIEKGQVREAALRLMVDVARKVDFDAVPKAVDHLRSAIVVNAINAVGKAYTRFGREEKETYRDEMQLCAQLAKMFE